MSPFAHKLNSQAMQIAFNVYKYFRKRKLDPNSYEYEHDIPLNKTVAEVTGICEKSVSRIVQKGRTLKDNESFKPTPKEKRVRRKKIEVDDSTKEVITKKITEYYTVNKKIPALKTLNAILKEENILHCGREYLRLLLHDLGLKKTRQSNKVKDKKQTDDVADQSVNIQDNCEDINIKSEKPSSSDTDMDQSD